MFHPSHSGLRAQFKAEASFFKLLSLAKGDIFQKKKRIVHGMYKSVLKYWAFWDWLCRTVMRPLAVLAVQPSLFPYFHVRNNEIYSQSNL